MGCRFNGVQHIICTISFVNLIKSILTMNISEHTGNFIQEMKRRNYAQNTIDNYVSCLNLFFGKSTINL